MTPFVISSLMSQKLAAASLHSVVSVFVVSDRKRKTGSLSENKGVLR